jgi:PAS domain-containing protein
LTGCSVYELDILQGADKRELAVERLHRGMAVPQMEACLPLPGAGEKTVLLAGQTIEIGHEHRTLFTSADMHPCKQAEDATRQSEERTSKALQMAPGPVATVALEGFRIHYVNQIFASATGWRLEEAVRRRELDLALRRNAAARAQLWRQVQQTGHISSIDIEVRTGFVTTCCRRKPSRSSRDMHLKCHA